MVMSADNFTHISQVPDSSVNQENHLSILQFWISAERLGFHSDRECGIGCVLGAKSLYNFNIVFWPPFGI